MKNNISQVVEKTLASRALPFYLMLLLCLVFSALLNSDLILDDYVHKVMISGSSSIDDDTAIPSYIYTYSDGEEATNSFLRHTGVAPWWTPDDFKFSFWRPVPQPTHVFDYTFFPDSTWLMRVHTLLWYFALVMAIALLYRQTIDKKVVAGLALVLYAIDDSHSLPIYFLATRNSTIAVLFAVLSLIAYIRWREKSDPPSAIACVACLLLALFSNEGAIAITAYFFAYECFVSKARISNRISVLMCMAMIVLVWRLIYDYLGYGVVGSGFYIDPIQDTGRFIQAAKNHIPVLLSAQWTLLPSDIYPMLGEYHQALFGRFGLAVSVLIILLLVPILFEPKNRFWLLGMVLAVIPCATAFPSDRMLYFVGIGAHALLANLLYFYVSRIRSPPTAITKKLGKVFFSLLVITFVTIHLLMAPASMYARAYVFKWFGDQLQMGADTLDREVMHGKTILVLNAIHPYIATNIFATRAAENKTLPDSIYVLSLAMNNSITTTIYRPDAYSLELRPTTGYHWGFFRGSSHPFQPGDTIELDDATVEILEVGMQGYPMKIRFVFAHPLEDPRYLWKRKSNNFDFADFKVPPIGGTSRI
jgi:hypothetical protein